MNNNTVIIKVCGNNLDNFFQNIISNDIKSLSTNSLLYSTILSPQGKFLHDFFMKKDGDNILIEINKDESKNLISVLKNYDLRESFSFSVLTTISVKVYEYEKNINHMGKVFKQKKYEKNKNFEVFTDPRSPNFLIRFWLNNNLGLQQLSCLGRTTPEELELHRIKRGIPNSELDLEKNKSFILNFNFDEINAVSFNKGCYVGQENTAKQKYRGKLKYKLRVLRLSSGKFPEINENIRVSEKKIGVMKSFTNEFGLALLRTDLPEMGSAVEINDNLATVSIL